MARALGYMSDEVTTDPQGPPVELIEELNHEAISAISEELQVIENRKMDLLDRLARTVRQSQAIQAHAAKVCSSHGGRFPDGPDPVADQRLRG